MTTPDAKTMTTPRYRPPNNGIHVCGFDDDEERSAKFHGPHVTELAVSLDGDPTPTFLRLRSEFGSGDDGDLLVDLFVGGDRVNDFWMRRQMLDQFRAALNPKETGL